jgi:hypothetical protein
MTCFGLLRRTANDARAFRNVRGSVVLFVSTRFSFYSETPLDLWLL